MAWGIPLTLVAALNILGDKNPLYYFLIFFYGFVLAGDVGLQQSIDKLTWVALAYGVFSAVINVMVPIQSYGEWTVQWMALGLMYEMGRWALTLAVLGLGHRFLNRTNNVLRYASEAAMPFYLLHMTSSVVTGYFAIQLDAPVAVKYPLIVLVATGLTLVAYELVRRWNMTRWLFGLKPLKHGMPVASNAKLDRQPL
jgi:surface polysaccharide O-acyltransferase-like enzyme